MKHFRLFSLAALFLAFCATAQAQGYWQWVGTTFEGLPYHTRTNFGNLQYSPQVVDYDAWSENVCIAYKENYVGKYNTYHDYFDAKGSKRRDFHNHQGEYASLQMFLPLPEPIIKPGQKVDFQLTFTRNKNCGWKYDNISVSLGTVGFYVGSRNMANYDTNKLVNTRNNVTFSVKLGSGTAGQEVPIYFVTMFGGKKQAAVFHYKWVDQKSSQGKKKWWQ